MWSWGVSLEFVFQELLIQSASIWVRIIFCASTQTSTTVRSLQLCTSEMHTHLNLASGNLLFRCGTFHLKCRLTSSEVFGWVLIDLIAEDTSEFILMLLSAVSSSKGSHPCARQYITTTTMLQWSGGMLWILSSFFLSPYSSLIILVQVYLCLIC